MQQDKKNLHKDNANTAKDYLKYFKGLSQEGRERAKRELAKIYSQDRE